MAEFVLNEASCSDNSDDSSTESLPEINSFIDDNEVDQVHYPNPYLEDRVCLSNSHKRVESVVKRKMEGVSEGKVSKKRKIEVTRKRKMVDEEDEKKHKKGCFELLSASGGDDVNVFQDDEIVSCSDNREDVSIASESGQFKVVFEPFLTSTPTKAARKYPSEVPTNNMYSLLPDSDSEECSEKENSEEKCSEKESDDGNT